MARNWVGEHIFGSNSGFSCSVFSPFKLYHKWNKMCGQWPLLLLCVVLSSLHVSDMLPICLNVVKLNRNVLSYHIHQRDVDKHPSSQSKNPCANLIILTNQKSDEQTDVTRACAEEVEEQGHFD